jgi:hypothetical protein
MQSGRCTTGRGATILLLLLFVGGTAFAQSGRGKVHGYVAFEDFSYNDVREGKIHATVVLSSTSRDNQFADTLQTNEYGSYDFDAVYEGEYRLTITAPGHTT